MPLLKVCATSDLHGWLPEIPDCDLLLIAGDFCPVNNHSVNFQRNWVMGVFWHWLKALRDRGIQVVGICGNHDFIGEEKPDVLEGLPWIYLCDNSHLYFRHPGFLPIFGCPHTLEFSRWAFMKTKEALFNEHNSTPRGSGIIVTHGPPYGYGDGVLRKDGSLEHIGSPALTKWIEDNQPHLVVFGHNHGGQGIFQLGKTVIANVSFLNDNYQPEFPPQLFEINF